jgi:hypothetical protein
LDGNFSLFVEIGKLKLAGKATSNAYAILSKRDGPFKGIKAETLRRHYTRGTNLMKKVFSAVDEKLGKGTFEKMWLEALLSEK